MAAAAGNPDPFLSVWQFLCHLCPLDAPVAVAPHHPPSQLLAQLSDTAAGIAFTIPFAAVCGLAFGAFEIVGVFGGHSGAGTGGLANFGKASLLKDASPPRPGRGPVSSSACSSSKISTLTRLLLAGGSSDGSHDDTNTQTHRHTHRHTHTLTLRMQCETQLLIVAQ